MPRIPVVLFSLALALAPGAIPPVSGQGAGPSSDVGAAAGQAEGEGVDVAPVVIDGDTLFRVRGVSAYPATRRAREIEARIRAIAGNPAIAAAALRLRDTPQSTAIVADRQLVLTVFNEDAVAEQVDRRVLAHAFLTRMGECIDAYRRAREPGRLWRHSLYALAATLALLAAAYVGRRIVRRLRVGLERRYRARVQGVEAQAFQVVKAEQIWRFLDSLLNVAWAVGVLATLYVYLRYVLMLFPWTRALGNSLLDIVTDPLRTMGVGLIGVIPNLAFLVILVLVTRFVLRLIRLFFEGAAAGTVTLRNFDPDWAWPTYRLLRLLVVALAIVVAYPYIPGSSSDAFKGVSLFVGVVFSLGSSSLIGNLIAGYSMTYRRAFRLGDRVKIGSHVGDVDRMRLLVTHLRTPKNEEVVVPNSAILGAEVVNYSSLARERGLILHTTVGIGYETPWRQVEAMLIEAAARTPNLLRDPAPFVLETALGDFCVTYEINVYCTTPQAMAPLYASLHRNILDVFNQYGVQIMTPAYENDPDQPKVVPKDHWYLAPAQKVETAPREADPASTTAP